MLNSSVSAASALRPTRIFVDLGLNIGDSMEAFVSETPDALRDWVKYGFECNPAFANNLTALAAPEKLNFTR